MSQVMIIEDSQALRKIMEVLLRREEIDTECYADGYTALRALEAPNHPVPAVVLLDLGLPPARNLPAIDGYAFARLLRSQLRFDAVVIIVLSGHNDVVTRVRARLVGARAYLSKPFKMQQLLALLRGYLALPAEAEEELTANCLM
jgi:twitching motility two-component system response regulator PilG